MMRNPQSPTPVPHTMAAVQPQRVYVGTRVSTIHVLNLNTETGALTRQQDADVGGLDCPSALAAVRGQLLYAAVRVTAERRPPAPGSAVMAFTVSRDGGLTHLNTSPSSSVSPCHLVCTDESVIAAHFAGGSVATFPTAADGALLAAAPAHQLGPPWWETTTLQPGAEESEEQGDPAYQLGPHAHCTAIDRQGKRAVVTDYGRSELHIFDIVEGGALAPSSVHRSAEDSGPRHVVFSPDGEWLFAVNANDSTVESLRYDAATGGLTSVSVASTLPARSGAAPRTETENTAPVIEVSRCGRWVWVGNHGLDPVTGSVATFGADPISGELTPRGHLSLSGVPVDALCLSECGRWLLVGSTPPPGSVRALKVNVDTGALSPVWGKPGKSRDHCWHLGFQECQQ